MRSSWWNRKGLWVLSKTVCSCRQLRSVSLGMFQTEMTRGKLDYYARIDEDILISIFMLVQVVVWEKSWNGVTEQLTIPIVSDAE